MRIAIGGFAGLIGTALVQRLRKEGHDVVTLTRHEPIQPSDKRWGLDTLSTAPPFLDDVDAVVNSTSEPVNLVGPNPCTNAEFTKALAKAIHRPSVMPFPIPAAKMIFGSQLVDEALCSGQRVKPAKLLEHEFEFRDTSITESITSALAGRR